VLLETDGSAAPVASYVYGDDLISQNRGGVVSYYHYDGQMSTRNLTGASELVTDTYAYDAFGILLAQTGTTVNNYLYTGEQYDPNIGFYYLRARYYNPELGRFLSVDPIEGSIYDPPSLHKYLYGKNNPNAYVDPSGEFFSLISLAISTAIQKILRGIHWLHAFGFMIIMKARIIAIQFASFINSVRIASITGWARYNTLLQQAIARYGHRGSVNMHHVVPEYFVRALRAANVYVPNFIAKWTVPLHPRYHQLITNAIRQAYPFGSAVFRNHPASISRLLRVLLDIYSQFPLPHL
jgi:RHS repeat-associated protein